MGSLLFSFLSVVVTLASPVASFVLLNNKRVGQKPGRFVAVMALSLVFPVLGVLVALVHKKLDPAELQGKPNELDRFHRREEIDAIKEKIDKSQEKLDRMLGKGVGEDSRAYVREAANLASLRASLQDGLRELSVVEHRIDSNKGVERIPVYVSRRPDGRLRFDLPYDISSNQVNNVCMALARAYKINLRDANECFGIADRKSNDFNITGDNFDVLVYAAKKDKIIPYGELLSAEVEESVSACRESFDDLIGLKEHDTELRDCITLDIMGPSTVALNMNGIVLAYAVAGEDGSVMVTGNGVPPRNVQYASMASALDMSLSRCGTMSAWVDMAASVCKSSDNVRRATESLEAGRVREQSRRERRAAGIGMLTVPKKTEKTANFIKR